MNGSAALIACLFVLTTWSSLVAQPPRISPRAPNSVELPVIGTLTGTLRKPRREGTGERFGQQIDPVGDANNDGLADWVVTRTRCDTIIEMFYPQELLLFKGERGRIPVAGSGERVGPSEVGALTRFIACADFDADGHPDIATRIWVIGDTSGGNVKGTQGHEVSSLVIFWGNADGRYSVADTTRLQPQTQVWLSVTRGIAADFDLDGVTDLLIVCSGGLSNGAPKPQPKLMIFRGHRGRRWGSDTTAPRTAAWGFWYPPEFQRSNVFPALDALDQDCDGALDIIFYRDGDWQTSRVSVLYGDPHGRFPDTTEVQSILPVVANARTALFSDVTGDGANDLLFACGGERVVRVYPGRPGQRLLAQYGAGTEEPRGDDEWWRRPWAEILTPDSLHDGWSPGGYYGLLPIGDASLDGTAEVWIRSYPFYLGYQAGEGLDSLADAWMRMPGSEVPCIARLGDIDGSGFEAIAFAYDFIPHDPIDPFPGAIRFIRGTREMPFYGYSGPRRLPHVPGESCGAVSSAIDDGSSRDDGSTPVDRERHGALEVHASYDRVTGAVILRLPSEVPEASVTVVSLLGHVVASHRGEVRDGVLSLATPALPAGLYFCSVRAGDRKGLSIVWME